MENITSRNLIAFLLCFHSIWICSQNLVPNGGFENHSPFDLTVYLPNGSAEYVSDWKEYNLWTTAYCHNDIIKRYGYEVMKKEIE